MINIMMSFLFSHISTDQDGTVLRASPYFFLPHPLSQVSNMMFDNESKRNKRKVQLGFQAFGDLTRLFEEFGSKEVGVLSVSMQNGF